MSTPREAQPPPSDTSAFEVLIDAAPDAIIVVDRDGRIREANPCAVELFGYDREELLGLDVEALVPEGVRRRRITESATRRRQALELNDNVVQGLVSLLWRLDRDDTSGAREVAEATLRSARRMMADLLEDLDEEIVPGGLVREAPTTTGAPTTSGPPTPPDGRIRVLIADDAADLRTLIRLRLSRDDHVVVVGEARDGEEAVRLVCDTTPDVVILDLGMPRMDGLEATERIVTAHPNCRVVVLSGYPEKALREQALAAGAVAYLEKQSDLDHVVAAVHEHGAVRRV